MDCCNWVATAALSLCVLTAPTLANADPETWQRPPLVRRMSIEHGLPSSEIQALAQDAAGFLWIGTDAGLVRYDGRQFERFDPVGAPIGAVEQVLVDTQDRVWYSVAEAGLVILDERRRLIRLLDVEQTQGWPSNDIWALAEDAEGAVWAGTYDGGLLRLSSAGESFETVPFAGRGDAVPIVNLLHDSTTGTLWVGTLTRGLYRVPSGARVAAPVAQSELADGQIEAMASAGEGVWIALRGHGICLLTPSQVLSCELYSDIGSELGKVNSLTYLVDGMLWAGRTSGLTIRDSGGHWRHVPSGTGASSGLPARPLLSLLLAADGGVWIGTHGAGLAYLSPLALQVDAWVHDPADSYSLPDSRVSSVAIDPQGLWVGTRTEGLYRYEQDSQRAQRIYAESLPPQIWDLSIADSGALWVAHQNGLSLFTGDDSLDRQWGRENLGVGVTDLILPLPAESALVSTYGSGLSIVARDRPLTLAVAADHHQPSQVEDIQRGHDEIWVASEQGLHRFDPSCECLIWNPISNERSFALAADSSGWWVAVTGAINHLRASDSGWVVDQTQAWTGRPPGGMATDDAGRLWVSGPEGLYILELGASAWRALAPGLGPIARELSSRPFERDNGALLLPSDSGLLRIDPARLPAPPAVQSLHLTRAGVRRQGEWTELDTGLPATLLPGDRDFSVTVESPLIGEAQSLRLQTRIEGLDSEWVESADGVRVLGVIPSGQYQFLSRVWHPADRNQVLQLAWPFEVLPPWWQRWPAMLAGVISLCLMVFIGYRTVGRTMDARHRRNLETEHTAWAERNALAKTDFLAHLSHEIRNPLSGLLGLLQLAEREAPPAQQARLGLMRAAGAQIQALVQDVIVWSQVQRGELALNPQPVRLDELANEVTQRWQPLARDRQMPLLVSGEAGTRVLADRARLGQLLDNLLGNALKFSERGQVLLSWSPSADNTIEIAVCDEGPGVPASAAERIFERREQSQRDGRGLGLGLSIGRQLAQMMGGSLVLDRRGWAATGMAATETGPGSRFVLTLPQAKPADGDDTPDPQQSMPTRNHFAVPPATQDAVPPSRRVVLVEDDPIQRARWATELTESGFVVSAQGEALAAMADLNQYSADALITDLGLPLVDGLQLIRLLRQQPAHAKLPILVVTARALPADRAAALEAGADEVLVKPVETAQVLAWLSACLRSSSSSQCQ